MHMRRKLLESGRFLIMLARYGFMLPSKDPSLKVLPVELPDPHGATAILTLKNRTLSPLAELFIRTVRVVTKSLEAAK